MMFLVQAPPPAAVSFFPTPTGVQPAAAFTSWDVSAIGNHKLLARVCYGGEGKIFTQITVLSINACPSLDA